MHLHVVHGMNAPSPARLIAEDEDSESESEPEDSVLSRSVAEEFVVRRGYNEDPGALCALTPCPVLSFIKSKCKYTEQTCFTT